MKKFRKNNEGFFICEECGRIFTTRQGIGNHIGKNYNIEEYYIKFLKEEGESICKICGEKTQFRDLFWGYKNTCSSSKCKKSYNLLKTKEAVFNKFGVENVYQLEDIKFKCRKQNYKKFGFEYAYQSPFIKNKKTETCLKNNGVLHPMQSKKIQEKSKKTCLKKYGVEFNTQVKNIFERQEKSAFHLHKYKDLDITYRGSFELDFLENYISNIEILNAPSIPYIFNGKNKIYFPDFYIPSLNLIIECKNSYLLKRDKNIIEAKEKATISNGFNYIIIVNKNYDCFNKLLK
jgi:hypothetical protein